MEQLKFEDSNRFSHNKEEGYVEEVRQMKHKEISSTTLLMKISTYIKVSDIRTAIKLQRAFELDPNNYPSYFKNTALTKNLLHRN